MAVGNIISGLNMRQDVMNRQAGGLVSHSTPI